MCRAIPASETWNAVAPGVGVRAGSQALGAVLPGRELGGATADGPLEPSDDPRR
jgi:hypothetical protein